MRNLNKTKKSGFTLIELLVVISIIGLLSSVVLASVQSARLKGINAAKTLTVKQVVNALALYYTTYGYYPAASVGGPEICLQSNSNNSSTCMWGGNDSTLSAAPNNTFTTAIAPYMKLPISTKDSFIVNGTDWGGIGYLCLTQSSGNCQTYAVEWISLGTNKGCAGGSYTKDTGVDNAIGSTNTYCGYTNDNTNWLAWVGL